jgi:hypothetical protein
MDENRWGKPITISMFTFYDQDMGMENRYMSTENQQIETDDHR